MIKGPLTAMKEVKVVRLGKNSFEFRVQANDYKVIDELEYVDFRALLRCNRGFERLLRFGWHAVKRSRIADDSHFPA